MVKMQRGQASHCHQNSASSVSPLISGSLISVLVTALLQLAVNGDKRHLKSELLPRGSTMLLGNSIWLKSSAALAISSPGKATCTDSI